MATNRISSTEYAKALGVRARRGREARVTPDELNKRRDLTYRFIVAANLIKAGESDLLALYKSVYPIWVEEVDHDSGHGLSNWFGEYNNPLSADLFRSFDRFLIETRNEDSATVVGWLLRINEASLRYKAPTFFFSSNFYAEAFPVEWLDDFVEKRNYYLGSVIQAFAKGYSPELVKKTHLTVWLSCSPAFVADFIKTRKPAILSSLAQLGNRGSTYMSEEVLLTLVEAGFEKSKEVKDYARKFGISFTDSAFYARVSAAKRKYPDLNDYTPEF